MTMRLSQRLSYTCMWGATLLAASALAQERIAETRQRSATNRGGASGAAVGAPSSAGNSAKSPVAISTQIPTPWSPPARSPIWSGTIETNPRNAVTGQGDGRFGASRGPTRTHTGVDQPAPVGTAVHPVAPGVVEFAGWQDKNKPDAGAGYHIRIRHTEGPLKGYSSTYMHLKPDESVQKGDKVAHDDVIGHVGRTGNVPPQADSHLHLHMKDPGGKLVVPNLQAHQASAPTAPSTIGHAVGGVLISPRALRDDAPVEHVEGIAVSLRALARATDPPDAQNLFGATRLHGFLLAADSQGPDCVLLLEKEPERPSLRLDDLAVAYCNLIDKPARPACTIDPRAKTLKQLDEIGRSIQSSKHENAIERLLRDWERVGQGPQDVQVFHVDPNTHFAKVMVNADYELKSICNGAAPAAGITSLTDRIAWQIEESFAKGGTSSIPISSQNRFWFNPGRVSYRTDGRLFMISQCEVVLLTEEEAITHEGERTGTSKSDPLAKNFANDLTLRFSELGREEPVFRELENLYRAVAVVGLAVSQGAPGTHDRVVDAAIRGVKVAAVQTSTTVAGRTTVKQVQGQSGNRTYVLWLPSCGGVSIDIDVRTMERDGDEHDLLPIGKLIAENRPDSRAVSWSVPLPCCQKYKR